MATDRDTVTLDDVNDGKQDALDVYDRKIVDGIRLQNSSGNPDLPDAVHRVMEQRTRIYVQDYAGALNGSDMARALAVIRSATGALTDIAANMVNAAGFVGNAASFVSAGAKVVTGLQGLAATFKLQASAVTAVDAMVALPKSPRSRAKKPRPARKSPGRKGPTRKAPRRKR